MPVVFDILMAIVCVFYAYVFFQLRREEKDPRRRRRKLKGEIVAFRQAWEAEDDGVEAANPLPDAAWASPQRDQPTKRPARPRHLSARSVTLQMRGTGTSHGTISVLRRRNHA
jgi:hypothetical protein